MPIFFSEVVNLRVIVFVCLQDFANQSISGDALIFFQVGSL